MPTNETLPPAPPARGTMALLLFHLHQAYDAVQEAQAEVQRCREAAHTFYGDAEWAAWAIPYQTRHGQLQAVMDALAAEGQHLQQEALGCDLTL